jgi:P-type Mg2+ transporter
MVASANTSAPTRPGGLDDLADAPMLSVYQRVQSGPRGLTEAVAADRLGLLGDNQPFLTDDEGPLDWLRAALRSPFVALLGGLGAVFIVIGDIDAASTVAVIVGLAVGLRIWQQARSTRIANGLLQGIAATVTVRRRAGTEDEPRLREVPLTDVVPGDIVVLAAGDVVPADVRIVASTDLHVDQSVLTGESAPAEKCAAPAQLGDSYRSPEDIPTLCFSGSVVLWGTATTVVIATGERTHFGALASAAARSRPESSFDSGVRQVGRALIRFMLVMAPIVLVVNGIVGGHWEQAAMFAVAVAVGLTPEMLPVIVTANLTRGASMLARENVVVSRLDAVQDLGAVDVLCVDKTGTLTEDRLVCAGSVDAAGRPDHAAAEFAFLATYFQDDVHSRLDQAILEMADEPMQTIVAPDLVRVKEVRRDGGRRSSAIVIGHRRGDQLLIRKGEAEEVLSHCALDEPLLRGARQWVAGSHRRGMQVMAVAIRRGPARLGRYDEFDECGMELVGFLRFVDPVRDSARRTIRALSRHHVAVKILTGDNVAVTRHVARQAGVDPAAAMRGADLDGLGEAELVRRVDETDVFCELSPAQKTRIVAALRSADHAVGFLGDGVNDVAALRLADVGVASHTATNAAKRASDLLLLDSDLAVLARGVVEGRRTLANTVKYVRFTASSNFGNALSVLIASALLPFLPILPIQLMVQNLLYDAAQLALPWDRVDAEYLARPRRWQSRGLVGFIATFGVLSSLFDVATFAVTWWVFDGSTNSTVFQTCWFVEGLLTQLMVVLVLRSRSLPWRSPRPGWPLVVAALTAAVLGIAVPSTRLAAAFGMTSLPGGYGVWLVVVVIVYGVAADLVKRWYTRRGGTWL